MNHNDEIIEEIIQRLIKHGETLTVVGTARLKDMIKVELKAKDKEWIELAKNMHIDLFDLYAKYGELDNETDKDLNALGFKRLEDGKIVRTT